MKRKPLERGYEQLTPRERFLVALEALSRGDDDEMDRLGRSCPRKAYEKRDAGFTDLIEASSRTAMLFAVSWLSAAQEYRGSFLAGECFVAARRGWFVGFDQGVRSAGKRASCKKDDPEPTVEELDQMGLAFAIDEFPKKYDDLHQKLGAKLKGVYGGFVRFCQAVGVEPEKLLACYPPMLDDIEDLRGLLENDEIEPNEEHATRVFETLVANWPEAVDRSYDRPLQESQPQHAAISQ